MEIITSIQSFKVKEVSRVVVIFYNCWYNFRMDIKHQSGYHFEFACLF